MIRFFNVVVFDIGNDPNVSRILASRVTRVLAFPWTFECSLAGVFLGHPDWVDIENIIV